MPQAQEAGRIRAPQALVLLLGRGADQKVLHARHAELQEAAEVASMEIRILERSCSDPEEAEEAERIVAPSPRQMEDQEGESSLSWAKKSRFRPDRSKASGKTARRLQQEQAHQVQVLADPSI